MLKLLFQGSKFYPSMASVAFAFALLLTSQVSGVLVRNEDRVAMSVSASAETAEIDKPEMSSDEILEMKVQGMLRDVEDMARSGETPEPEKIRTIKDIVEGELVPDLKACRD